MQRHELGHLIRAAGAITDEYEFVVVGSQSVLGSLDRPPAECLVSSEADLYPLNAEDKADLIDYNIGEGSPFHDTHGYYAQGDDSRTAVCRPAGASAWCGCNPKGQAVAWRIASTCSTCS